MSALESGRAPGRDPAPTIVSVVMGVPAVSALTRSRPVAEDGDPHLERLLRSCAAATPADAWHLARSWTGPVDRGSLVQAALGLAGEIGRDREARAAMTAAARAMRESEGGRAASARLAGTDVVFRAEAVAQEAALAVLLRDHLSQPVGAALAAPWAAVFGDPLAPDRIDATPARTAAEGV